MVPLGQEDRLLVWFAAASAGASAAGASATGDGAAAAAFRGRSVVVKDRAVGNVLLGKRAA